MSNHFNNIIINQIKSDKSFENNKFYFLFSPNSKSRDNLIGIFYSFSEAKKYINENMIDDYDIEVFELRHYL